MATGAPTAISADLDGLLRLIADLRAARPDVFINCTVGTWASPFWVLHADSVWRQGGDHGYFGAGNPREQWITYRDKICYERFASRSPLYPLNSMMLHGFIVSDRAGLERMPRDADSIRHEARTFVGSGTGLQELYVSPHQMTDENWDTLAESIKWARANADILADSHWLGGDPGKGEVYGWGAWSPRGGIVTLRNPTEKAQSFSLEIGAALELPANAPQKFSAKSPWPDSPAKTQVFEVGRAQEIQLAPFEVVTLEFAKK